MEAAASVDADVPMGSKAREPLRSLRRGRQGRPRLLGDHQDAAGLTTPHFRHPGPDPGSMGGVEVMDPGSSLTSHVSRWRVTIVWRLFCGRDRIAATGLRKNPPSRRRRGARSACTCVGALRSPVRTSILSPTRRTSAGANIRARATATVTCGVATGAATGALPASRRAARADMAFMLCPNGRSCQCFNPESQVSARACGARRVKKGRLPRAGTGSPVFISGSQPRSPPSPPPFP